MTHRPEKKSRIILDYVTVSYREILGIGLILVLGVGAGLTIWYVYFRQPDPRQTASREINSAERSLSRASSVLPPDREDLSRALGRASDMLTAAREYLRRSDYTSAISSAQTSQRLSQEVYDTLRGPAQHVGLLTDIGGNVDYQRQNSQSWLPAHNGLQLYPGDKVRTLGGSGAKLRMRSGAVYTLDEDAVMQVPEPGIDTRTGRPEEGGFLQRGRLTVESPEDTSSRIRTPELEARVPGSGTLLAERDETGERTEVGAGQRTQVLVTPRSGEEFTLEQERGVVVDPGGIAERFQWIRPPRLTQPAEGKVFVVEDPEHATVQLDWEAVPNAERYRLEVSRLRVFTGNVHHTQDLDKTSAFVPNPPYGTWWWRVTSIGPDGRRSLPSVERNFKVRRPDQALGEAPNLEYKWPLTQLGHKVLLEGITEPGTLLTVSVNGSAEEQVEVDAAGRFEEFVDLTRVGANQIVLRAQSPGGAEVTETLPPVMYETY